MVILLIDPSCFCFCFLFYYILYFFYQGFLSQTVTIHRTAGKGKDSTRSQTLRHLFATLHVRRLSRIFNCNACVYQTATRWDLPPYQITICWLIMQFFGFCYSDLTWKTGEFELASTMTFMLQANRLTKCVSRPK